ncbi:hypothetical protein [Vibrio harveyi]|uniref:hypothetical protein n=1 Tax=Vibrio harveyi TaxID=669 RepID=UPI00165D32AF|nr:hypothetical protein [Vibrio harveyi]
MKKSLTDKPLYVGFKNKRMGIFYTLWLKNYGIDVEWDKYLGIKENERKVNQAISQRGLKTQISIIKALEKDYETYDFLRKYIMESDRFCAFIWCYVKNITNHSKRLFIRNASDKRTAAKLALHHINSRLDNPSKITQELIKKWEESYKENKLPIWFNKNNHEKVNWAWGYLVRNGTSIEKKTWKPTMPSEQRYAIICFFDLLSHDERTIITKRIKKSWEQRNFRLHNQTKKEYSINLSKATNEKLNTISKLKSCNRNEVIELLIGSEFKKISKSESNSLIRLLMETK